MSVFSDKLGFGITEVDCAGKSQGFGTKGRFGSGPQLCHLLLVLPRGSHSFVTMPVSSSVEWI